MKTLRESLGLTAQWFANQFGLDPRSVYYWENGRNKISSDSIELLNSIDKKVTDMVNSFIGQIKLGIDKHNYKPEEITLIRYKNDEELWRFEPDFKPLPVSCHAMMLSRLMAELNELEITVHIIFMDVAEYEKWLDQNKDSVELRTHWAELKSESYKEE